VEPAKRDSASPEVRHACLNSHDDMMTQSATSFKSEEPNRSPLTLDSRADALDSYAVYGRAPLMDTLQHQRSNGSMQIGRSIATKKAECPINVRGPEEILSGWEN